MKLLETIRLNNGSFENLTFHQKRLNRSRRELFGFTDELQLNEVLQTQTLENEGLFKCRIIYAKDIDSIDILPYTVHSIKSLKLVNDDNIDYKYKYLNRHQLEKLFNQRGNCDDVLIIKNGWVTDSSYANVLFFDGVRWLTPDKPLLAGTQRASLLMERKIQASGIKPKDIKTFGKARLINAMIRFEDQLDIDIENILL